MAALFGAAVLSAELFMAAFLIVESFTARRFATGVISAG
jgi:hypothetical protein